GYGAGVSERHLGQALQDTRAAVVVGSKIRLEPPDLVDIEAAVPRLVDESLIRLQRDAVDLMQLHNPIGKTRDQEPGWLAPDDVFRVIDAFARLQRLGKLRFWGINGIGDIGAVQDCLGAEMHSIQVCHNLLNPTAAMPLPNGFPFADQRDLIGKAAARGIGVLAFRVLAGGALSGTALRHANASDTVETIYSSSGYDSDVALAQSLQVLVDQGFANDLVEVAIRFAATTPGVSSAVIGVSTISQLETAIRSAANGPLPAAALRQLHDKWARFGLA
ncbi:MAG: aldo/keto reductase, partial [bacterium]